MKVKSPIGTYLSELKQGLFVIVDALLENSHENLYGMLVEHVLFERVE